ncbi:hypothetical protein NFHSH190041_26960 [Shewanella sp. NFH-SH190041]|nr:hypothetical protein NFHSH190041_26960 [Shewanella sp. NFH-SH190041]
MKTQTISCAVMVLGCLLGGQVSGEGYYLDLPAELRDQGVGTLLVDTDGRVIRQVDTQSLIQSIGRFIKADIKQQLQQQQSWQPQALAEKGITLILDASTLTLSFTLAENAEAVQDVSTWAGYSLPQLSEAAPLAINNNFTLMYDYVHEDKSDDTYLTLEWLGQANWGGSDGINLTWDLYYEGDMDNAFRRGDVTAWYDVHQWPLRISAGDIDPTVGGHLPSVNLGGVMLQSSYAELQPTRVLSPGGNQVLNLRQSADVKLFVNGYIVRKIRLDAGKYRLSDLPLNTGANDILVKAYYADGRTEVFRFSQFYNSRLLTAGLWDYSLSFGYPNQLDGGSNSYQSNGIATGFAEYGVTDFLTLGTSGLYSSAGQLWGLTGVIGTPLGNISLRGTRGSYDGKTQRHGEVYSIDFETNLLSGQDHNTPNLRFSFEDYHDFVATPWEDGEPLREHRYLLNYSYFFNESWDLQLSGLYSEAEAEADSSLEAEAGINWTGRFLRVGLAGIYDRPDMTLEEDLKLELSLEWSWGNPQGYRARANYNSRFENMSAEFVKANEERVGSYGYELSANYNNEDEKDGQKAALSYYANRWRGEVSTTRNSGQGQNNLRTSLRLNSSLAYADGQFALGNLSRGPFAMVSAHKTLNADVHVNPDFKDQPEALATSEMPAVVDLGRGFNRQELLLDVPEAEWGYDWGQGQLSLTPGALTGHSVTIGSDATLTVVGTLLQEDGHPVALLRGVANCGDDSQLFFTNKGGRFVLEGVPPGECRMTLSSPRFGEFTLQIEQDGPALRYLEPIFVVRSAQ